MIKKMQKFIFKLFYSFLFIVFCQYTYASHNLNLLQDEFGFKDIEVDQELVGSIIKEIESKHVDNLINHLVSDIDKIILQVTAVLDNMQNDLNVDKVTREEVVNDYKRTLVFGIQSLSNNILSNSTKEYIIFILLSSFESIIASESKLNRFLNNPNLANLMFFASALGIQFSCIDDMNKIFALINSRCGDLQNEEISDIKYQVMVYEILKKLSILINEKDMFGKIQLNIFKRSLLLLKDKINNFSFSNLSNKKKSNNKNKK